MNPKPKHQASEKHSSEDLATFEELPEKTKDLMKLKEQEEKTTGPKHIETTRKIEEKTHKSKS